MSQFEFIGVGVSIVLALSVARLLEGLRDSFEPRRRYWIHTAWVVNKLINTLLYFWAGWAAREIGSWNFAEFVFLLIGPGVLFLQAHALVTSHPDRVTDWSEHFWQIRRWFFAINILHPIVNLVSIYVISEAPFPSPETGPLLLILLFSVVGAVSTSERVHGFIAVLAFLNLTLGIGGNFLRSG